MHLTDKIVADLRLDRITVRAQFKIDEDARKRTGPEFTIEVRCDDTPRLSESEALLLIEFIARVLREE